MAPKKKGKGKKKKPQAQQRTKKAPSAAGAAGPGSAAAPGPATSGEPSQHGPASDPLEDGAPPQAAAAGPKPGDRGQLAGLRSRPELNGRRVEVEGPAAGKDGAPRFRAKLLFGVGAGTVLKVKAANLELDRVLDPALNTLVAEMQALAPGAPPPEERRDWAGGLPIEVLAKVAETHVARTEAGCAAFFKGDLGWSEEHIQERLAKRKREGPSLFVFALVCKGWRKAQLKVGGPLRTRVDSDVVVPGSVALAKWALAEGCPRERGDGFTTMASAAAQHGDLELVRWLIREQGFMMDEGVSTGAAWRGNLELVQWLWNEGCEWDHAKACGAAVLTGRLGVLQWARENGWEWNAKDCSCAAMGGQLEILQWLRAEGCPWDISTCYHAVDQGHVEVLRWVRENGCPWRAVDRDRAAAELGYSDDLGNLVVPVYGAG